MKNAKATDTVDRTEPIIQKVSGLLQVTISGSGSVLKVTPLAPRKKPKLQRPWEQEHYNI